MCLYVPCCGVSYDFRIDTMFVPSLPPIDCRRARVLFTLFEFACDIGVQYIVFCICFGFHRLMYLHVTSFSGLSIFDCSFGIL